MDLKDKVAVITGAASGIGAACARAFADKGAKVVVADISADAAKAVAQDVGGLAIACDVGKEDQINALVAETEGAFGPIDIFFSNAAVATGRGPLNTDIDVWFDQWDINVMSHVYAVRAVLPAMLKRGEGYLIHTASMAGVLSSHGNLPYAVTKHAVVGLAEWLAFTYRHKGIRTSLLAPLGVRTPMLDTSSAFAESAVGPIKEPGDVAAMVTDAVEAERFMILTDQIAQKWMSGKTDDIERWLSGMNRLQEKIEAK